MKLYLSSYGLGNHIERLYDMVGDNKRVLFIDNAKDYVPEAERAMHIAEKKLEWEAAGFLFDELDLREYFVDNSELEDRVHKAGLMWGSGGNTFLLRRAMHYSGLDAMLSNHLKHGDIVYGGSSAGSIIMTKSLRGTELGDSPYEIAGGYKEDIIWDGLAIIHPQIVPHVGSDWLGAKAMEDYFKAEAIEYVALRDGEVYVVDGEYEEHLI